MLGRKCRRHGRRRLSVAAVAALAGLVVTVPADAQPLPREALANVYSLSAEASAEVDNDRLTALLAVQAEAEDAARLADRINRTMGWALETLEAYPAVRAETRDYRTWPRYDRSEARRLIGWSATQTLALEAEDFEAVGQAVQALQGRLQVQDMRLSATPETRKRATDALIRDALGAFRERAALIEETMGASGHRVLEANVETDESRGVRPEMEMRGRALVAEADAAVAMPALAAGSSRVTVRVHGRIQLDPPTEEGSR